MAEDAGMFSENPFGGELFGKSVEETLASLSKSEGSDGSEADEGPDGEGESDVSSSRGRSDGSGSVTTEEEEMDTEAEYRRYPERFEGKYLFHGKYVFLTYARSKFEDHKKFYEALRGKWPEGTVEIFGGKELHEDDYPHYHVVMRFDRRYHFTDARKSFGLKGDTKAIKIKTMNKRQSPMSFLEGTQAYCAKDDNPNVFGRWIEPYVGGDLVRKRRYEEIIAEEDEDRAKQMLQEADPRRFIYNYTAVKSYLSNEKKRRRKETAVKREWWNEWKVPIEMEKWKWENIDNPMKGRPTALVLVGNGKTGKTSWAKSFGRPMEMTKEWNMKAYGKGYSHIVVNNAGVKEFGPNGKTYWREVLGCRENFSATDKYMEVEDLEWNLACVWCCNFDQDPRRFPEVKKYMEDCGVVVVEVRDKLFRE
ncbi:hypothetical protein APSETT444_003338 [Aspergillus pseudonomiae]